MQERALWTGRIRAVVRLANEACRIGPKGLSAKGIGPCLMYGKWGFSHKMHGNYKGVEHLCVLCLLRQRCKGVGGPSVEIHPETSDPQKASKRP